MANVAPGSEDEVTEQTGPTVLGTIALREQYRDDYIASSGSGIEKCGPFVISTDDGDLIQLKGGLTGASFYGVIFWYAAPYQGRAKENMTRSKDHIRRYCELEVAPTEAYLEAEAQYKAIQKAMTDAETGHSTGIKIIHETDVVTLKPGETFTLKNDENYYAKKYFTEQVGMIQWCMAFEVMELQYSEAYNGNADVGAEIEKLTEVKGLATKLYKFLKPGTPPPEDFEIKSEEEGGFEEITGKSLFDQLGITSGALKEGLTAAALIALAVLAIVIMITLRQPLGALAGATAGLITEAIER